MSKQNIEPAEITRQRNYIQGSKIGREYEYPVFSSAQAIRSARKSGYRNTARASREIVDNAIEAGAKNIYIGLDCSPEASSQPDDKKRRSTSVTGIFFADDGPGMYHKSQQESMLRAALSYGAGIHEDDPCFIGKFGVGLINSSIHQSQLVDVYSRTAKAASDGEGWNRIRLDIREGSKTFDTKTGVIKMEDVEVDQDLPDCVREDLKKRKVDLTHGTVVHWRDLDNLTVKKREYLRKRFMDDFQVVYRRLLDGCNVFVDSVEPLAGIDPLFLTPGLDLYLPPDQGGARPVYDEQFTVLAVRMAGSSDWDMKTVGEEAGRDPMTGFVYDISRAEAEEIQRTMPEGGEAVIGQMHARISNLPYPGFMKGSGGKKSPARRRWDVRDQRHGISFVRANREIDTVWRFPKGEDARRDEFGAWPVLQSYAAYVAVELCFEPALDGPMGIGNDKQTTSPCRCVWKALANLNIDKAMHRAIRLRTQDGIDHQAHIKAGPDVDLPSILAAEQVMGSTKKIVAVMPDVKAGEALIEAEEAAKAESAVRKKGGDPVKNPEAVEEEREAQRQEQRRYAIVPVDNLGNLVWKPGVGENGQIIVQLNTKTGFYQLYAQADQPARNLINLMLFAWARTEMDLQVDPARYDMMVDIREGPISTFLTQGSRRLERLLPSGDAPDEAELLADAKEIEQTSTA